MSGPARLLSPLANLCLWSFPLPLSFFLFAFDEITAMEPKFSSSNHVSSSVEDVSGRAAFDPNADSGSDNETGERPVREKLKKASIASMPKESLTHTSNDGRSKDDSLAGHAIVSNVPDRMSPLAKQVDDELMYGGRGRADRKRSFDDMGTSRTYEAYTSAIPEKRTDTPTRKKSMNIHDNDPRDEDRAKAPRKTPEPELEKRRIEHDDGATVQSEICKTSSITGIELLSQENLDDSETSYSMFGPRKKRSRDHLDAEVDREQKIVATEEARAHRRSEEIERDLAQTTTPSDTDLRRGTGATGITHKVEDPQKPSNSDTSEVMYVLIEVNDHALI